jgi:hypothetical protein
MSGHDVRAQRARAVPIEDELARRGVKLRGQGTERVGPCPKCGGDDRFAIHLKKQIWNCRGCAVGGDVIKLIEHLDGVDFRGACDVLIGGQTRPKPSRPMNGKEHPHPGEPRKVVVAGHPYEDESGTVLFEVQRVEFQNPDGTYVEKNGKRKKSFRQRRPDPERPGAWIWNVDGVRKLPYRLPELVEAIGCEHPVIIVEGERKVDRLREWNVPATCCAGGAGKWVTEHSGFLQGADVVLLPDNDSVGRTHMSGIAASLRAIAKRVRVLRLPGLPEKGDVIDWAAAGGTVEQFHHLVETAAVDVTVADASAAVLPAAAGRVVITGSDADAAALRERNISSIHHAEWRPELNEGFRQQDVVLIPQDSDAGWRLLNEIGGNLDGIAKRLRVLIPLHADGMAVWFDAGGTVEQFVEMMGQATEWTRPLTEEVSIEEVDGQGRAEAQKKESELLAALTRMRKGVEYERLRADAAKKLGVSKSAIDSELEARRGDAMPAPLHGHWIVEPWAEPVDGDDLLRDIIARLRRHILFADDDALAVALWVVFAWLHDDAAVHSPILCVTSAEPECGKSTLLGLVAHLLPKAITSVEISEAAVYRAISMWSPSFCIDEFDTVLSDDNRAGLRSVINSGHTRGTGIIRCTGEDSVPQLFSTFAPKCIGMIGSKMPAATASRCITIELRRKVSKEKVDRFEHKDDPGLGDLRRRLARFSADNADDLAAAGPKMPVDFGDRNSDNWRLPFAIGDLCGKEWGAKARAAALKISGKADSRTIGVRLLADIKAVFDGQPDTESLLSAVIVEELKSDPEKPWIEYARGKPLTQGRLARLLRAYKITSQSVWTTGSVSGKGYRRADFADAWDRYLRAEPPIGEEQAS